MARLVPRATVRGQRRHKTLPSFRKQRLSFQAELHPKAMQQAERLEQQKCLPCSSLSGLSSSRGTCRRTRKKKFLEACEQAFVSADDDKHVNSSSSEAELPYSSQTDDSTTASEGEEESVCSTPTNVVAEEAPEVEDSSSSEEALQESLLADDKTIFALAKLLNHMAQSSKPSGPKTAFHAMRPPSVSLSSFAARIHTFFKCSEECFVLCLVYIDRIIKSNPDFEVSTSSCHRLLVIGSMVAAKFHDDEYASNEYYAKVGGISLQELNALELEFLQLLNWKLCIEGPEYNWFLQSLRGIA